jgi:hypothetical protein
MISTDRQYCNFICGGKNPETYTSKMDITIKSCCNKLTLVWNRLTILCGLWPKCCVQELNLEVSPNIFSGAIMKRVPLSCIQIEERTRGNLQTLDSE